jgi:hypothetical protein
MAVPYPLIFLNHRADSAATFREQLLRLTSVRLSMMFHEAQIYFIENRVVGTDSDGKDATGVGGLHDTLARSIAANTSPDSIRL